MADRTRHPHDETRSFIVVWDKNTPRVKESHWVPGYSPAHASTREAALRHAGEALIAETAALRERWARLSALVAEQEVATDSFGFVKVEDVDLTGMAEAEVIKP